MRGWRKLEEGRPLEALADLELAIKLDPTCTAAYNQRGIVRRILALEDFNMADKLTRDDPTVHGQLRELSKWTPAVWEKARTEANGESQAKDADFLILSSFGIAVGAFGEYEKAKKLLERSHDHHGAALRGRAP